MSRYDGLLKFDDVINTCVGVVFSLDIGECNDGPVSTASASQEKLPLVHVVSARNA